MPGPSSSTTISISAAHPAAEDADLVAGRGKRLRVDQQVGDHLPESRIVTRHPETVGGAAALEADLDRDVMLPSRVSLATVVSVVSRRRKSTGAISCRCNSASRPAGIGNVRDQPVQPFDVVFDHRQQPGAAVLVARQVAASRPRSAARSAGSSIHGRRRRRTSRSPRCGYRARPSCRAARRRDARSRRGGG